MATVNILCLRFRSSSAGLTYLGLQVQHVSDAGLNGKVEKVMKDMMIETDDGMIVMG